MKRHRCITAEDWYFGAYRNDELNLIFTGWFIWNAYEDLCERAEEAIMRDVLEGLANGSITEDQLISEMEEE